jgi:hypothetical protein
MTIVRVSIALAESVARWLDNEMPGVLEVGHKEGWVGTKDQEWHNKESPDKDKAHLKEEGANKKD